MKPYHIPCGPLANESEQKAIETLKNRLLSTNGEEEWFLLTNLLYQSDEIDILVIGPSGVRVVEVKHWDSAFVKNKSGIVKKEVEKVARKAKKVGTSIRKNFPALDYVPAVILLTTEPSEIQDVTGKVENQVYFYSLKQWQELLKLDSKPILSQLEIKRIAETLEPNSKLYSNGDLRRIAGYVNLELLSSKEERFHRIYKGIRSNGRDKVILHLYDLSASNEKNSEKKAKRGFEALRRLSLSTWAPRILDSFQDAPGYNGEIYFYTIVDPSAPSLDERCRDQKWDSMQRVQFAKKAVEALKELHQSGEKGEPFLHRNLNSKTILVKFDNTPIFIDFEYAKIPEETTVGPTSPSDLKSSETLPPEVCQNGLSASSPKSDIYSLCASLLKIFDKRKDEESIHTCKILEKGIAEIPEDRITLDQLSQEFSNLLGEKNANPPAPPARFWTEDQIVEFRGGKYKIVSRLGSGGIGSTFKVVQLDENNKDIGNYVGKIVYDSENGKQVLSAYKLARAHVAQTPSLSTIFEVAEEWKENNFVALLNWIEGNPLSDYIEIFPLLAEELGETSPEALAAQWLKEICEALDSLHGKGLIHGDISPKNLIVKGSNLVLTDYDFVTKIGIVIRTPGTLLYCSPSRQEGKQPVSPSDDLYSLGASFYHVLTGKQPPTQLSEKKQGLTWNKEDGAQFLFVSKFLEKSTHINPLERFSSAKEALHFLKSYNKTMLEYPEALPSRDKMLGDHNRYLAAFLKETYDKFPDKTPTDIWKEIKTDSRFTSCSGNFFKVSKIVREADTASLNDYLAGKLSFSKIYASVKGVAAAQSMSSKIVDREEESKEFSQEKLELISPNQNSQDLPEEVTPLPELPELREEQIEWLKFLLQSYPGSQIGNQETRGLDSQFAEKTYIETELEKTLLTEIENRQVQLVILCGNAGDGKTALLQKISERNGLEKPLSSSRILKKKLDNGLTFMVNLDGSASFQGRTSDELLDEIFKPFQNGKPKEEILHLLAINDGRLLEWLESREDVFPSLTQQLKTFLQEGTTNHDSYIRFINLNQRSLVGSIHSDQKKITTDFLVKLVDRLYGGDEASQIWKPCSSCSAQERCEVFRAAKIFGPSSLLKDKNETSEEIRSYARQQLFKALQAVHFRGETHITMRELRAALVYILFGINYCRDYHDNAEKKFLPYWDRAFDPNSPGRQGEVLTELLKLDPALEPAPQLDRYLLSQLIPWNNDTAPIHDSELSLQSAKRRAYFELTERDLEKFGKIGESLPLAEFESFDFYRDIPFGMEQNLCKKLCKGISKLENLPPKALDRIEELKVVPLPIKSRTPTETAFWVEKPLASFRLEPEQKSDGGTEYLHRNVFLVYRYKNGEEERLRLGAELFHILLEVGDGYYLGDVSSDDTFANLSVFVQRLLQEDEQEMYAWNPMDEEEIYKVYVDWINQDENRKQKLILKKLSEVEK
jgi:serine/threonine protein kinase